MNFTLPYACGEDYYVQALQNGLYIKMQAIWGVTSANYNQFGRVYRNKNEKGWIPEFYDPVKGAYVDGFDSSVRGGMFFDDRLAVISWFGMVDPVKRNSIGDAVGKFQLMFFVRLDKINPGAQVNQQGQRMDEVCINDVKNYIQSLGYNFTITDTYRGADKVMELYSGYAKNDSVIKSMQPFLCFRIDLELPYDPMMNTPSNSNARTLIPMQRSIVLYIVETPDPAALIAVGNGKFIQHEYAPGSTLTPMRTGDANGYLAGRNVELPFFYNDNVIVSNPNYNMGTGVWTRGANVGGFYPGDFVTITFTDTQH